MGILESKYKEFGVPSKKIDQKSIKDWVDKFDYVAKFTLGKSNLLVVHGNFYNICAKLMQMRYMRDMWLDMKWLSQSQLDFNSKVVYGGVKVLALVGLYVEEVTAKLSLPGALINSVINSGGQVLLGCSTVDKIEGAFPYDLDMIENEFDVWKGV